MQAVAAIEDATMERDQNDLGNWKGVGPLRPKKTVTAVYGKRNTLKITIPIDRSKINPRNDDTSPLTDEEVSNEMDIDNRPDDRQHQQPTDHNSKQADVPANRRLRREAVYHPTCGMSMPNCRYLDDPKLKFVFPGEEGTEGSSGDPEREGDDDRDQSVVDAMDIDNLVDVRIQQQSTTIHGSVDTLEDDDQDVGIAGAVTDCNGFDLAAFKIRGDGHYIQVGFEAEDLHDEDVNMVPSGGQENYTPNENGMDPDNDASSSESGIDDDDVDKAGEELEMEGEENSDEGNERCLDSDDEQHKAKEKAHTQRQKGQAARAQVVTKRVHPAATVMATATTAFARKLNVVSSKGSGASLETMKERDKEEQKGTANTLKCGERRDTDKPHAQLAAQEIYTCQNG